MYRCVCEKWQLQLYTNWNAKVVIYCGHSAVAGSGCDNHRRDRRSWAVTEPIFSISETSDSTSEQLMTMFSPVVLFCSIPLISICHDLFLESAYYFNLVNSKLHCGFHLCRACFSFSGGLHVSGQIWPKWRSPDVPMIICQGCMIICIFYGPCINLIWYLHLFLLNKLCLSLSLSLRLRLRMRLSCCQS